MNSSTTCTQKMTTTYQCAGDCCSQHRHHCIRKGRAGRGKTIICGMAYFAVPSAAHHIVSINKSSFVVNLFPLEFRRFAVIYIRLMWSCVVEMSVRSNATVYFHSAYANAVRAAPPPLAKINSLGYNAYKYTLLPLLLLLLLLLLSTSVVM